MQLLQLDNDTKRDGIATVLSTSPCCETPTSQHMADDTSLTLETIQKAQPSCDQWAIAQWDHSQTDLPQLVADIQAGSATAVSDGSFKNANGTSAFLICSKDVTNRIIGVNAVPGSPEE